MFEKLKEIREDRDYKEKDIDVLVGSKFPIENNKEHTFLEIK